MIKLIKEAVWSIFKIYSEKGDSIFTFWLDAEDRECISCSFFDSRQVERLTLERSNYKFWGLGVFKDMVIHQAGKLCSIHLHL